VKEVFKVPNFYDNHLIKSMGKLGVDLFFVLNLVASLSPICCYTKKADLGSSIPVTST